MKKAKKQKIKMNIWMRLHAAFTIFLLVSYLALGAFGGFGMLGDDLKGKYAWAADTTIGVFVDALPGRPVISATASCSANVSIVSLSWTQSEGATIYSVTRNGMPLVSGFQTMSYEDNTVIGGQNYSYVVTASGSSGDSVSDPVVVRASDCLVIEKPDPTLTLVSFDGKEYVSGNTLATKNKMFKITGTTNMPNASIQIKTMPGPIFVSTLQSNINGYWEYYLPAELAVGSYNFVVMAADPDNFLRNVTQNYAFQILKQDEVIPVPPVPTPVPTAPTTTDDNGGGGHKNKSSNDGQTKSPAIVQENQNKGNIGQGAAVEVGSLAIKLKRDEVFRTQDLQMTIIFGGLEKLLSDQKNKLLDLKYEILDAKGKVVFSNEGSEKIFGNKLQKAIHVPEEFPNGHYKIRISTTKEGKLISAENSFVFVELPIFNLGGGIMITYSKLISQIGWLLILAMLLLIFMLLMFLLEYYKYKQALTTVAEDSLAKRGMFSRRKGVSP
ncbi:MAG: hypothetical protein PHW24_04245 [Candidatus Moranbacteria bacterium]|nr:hypothetical protein [Candidatus Moranbacteria bacterium]